MYEHTNVHHFTIHECMNETFIMNTQHAFPLTFTFIPLYSLIPSLDQVHINICVFNLLASRIDIQGNYSGVLETCEQDSNAVQ